MKYLLRFNLLFFTLLSFTTTIFAQKLEDATTLFAAGKYIDAKTVFEAILEKTPNNIAANYYLGATCFKLGEWDVAEKYLKIKVFYEVFRRVIGIIM